MLKELKDGRGRVFIGCFLLMFIMQGCMQSFPIFMPQIVKDTGWKVSQVVICSTTGCTGAFLFNMLLPKALKRLTPKQVLLIGCLFLTVELVLSGLSRNVYIYWFAGALSGISIAWGTSSPCTIIITNWFEKNRSQFVAGIVAAAMFGSVVVNPIMAVVIDAIGWRKAYIYQGILGGALAALVVLFLIRSSPEGEKLQKTEEQVKSRAAVRKDAKFFLMAGGIFLIGLSTNAENYLPAFWQSRGLSSTTASLIMSCYAFFAAIGAMFMSRINDRLGGKKYVLLTCVVFVVPLLIMAYTGVVSLLPLLILCCVPLSLGAKKAVVMTPPLIVNEVYGRENYSSVIGFFAAMLQLGVAMSNLIIGPLTEVSYSKAFTAMIVLNILGAICIFFVPFRKENT